MDDATLEAEGWERLPTVRYSAALGPTWARVVDGQPMVGLQAQEHLGNDNFGIVHGGAMMTFADMALGFGVGQVVEGAQFVTIQAQVQFVSAGRVGDFITCEPEVFRKTSRLVFVRGMIRAGDRNLASADGIFQIVDPDRMAAAAKAS